MDREKNRPDPDYELSNGLTAVMVASFNDRTYALQALLERGAHANKKSSLTGRTALVLACLNRNLSSMRLLLRFGADPNIADHNGKDAFHYGRESLNLPVLNLLAKGFLGTGIGDVGSAMAGVYTAKPLRPCRWGCGAMLAEDNISAHLHELSACPKRVVACPNGCDNHGVELWAEEVDEHLREKCSKRLLTCELCGDSEVRDEDMRRHLRDVCPHRVVSCGHCTEGILDFKMERHHRGFCKMMPRDCPLLCGEMVSWSSQLQHRRSQCPNRIVRCRVCGEEVTSKDRDEHENESCQWRQIPCVWGCEGGTRPVDKVEHENNLCELRLVSCRNHCGEDIPFCQIEAHEHEQCLNRFVLCPEGCGLQVRSGKLERHVNTQCEKRMVSCQLCALEMRAEFMAEHSSTHCKKRLVACGLGCGEKIPIDLLQEHKAKECPKRIMECPRSGCRSLFVAETLKTHLDWNCDYRQMFCPFGCRATVLAIRLNEHKTKECPMAIVSCEDCDEKVRRKDLKFHRSSKGDCLRKQRRAPDEWGE
jgi:hypothetical protein